MARSPRTALTALAVGLTLAASSLGSVDGAVAAPTAAPAGAVPAAVTAAGEPSAAKIPAKYLKQKLTWRTCSFDGQVKAYDPKAPTTRCATIKVPMDWKHPTAHRDIKLAIAYSKATGRSKGLMVTNPGGPGGSGLTLSAALGLDQPRLFTDYNLLGFDPRGFGQSERVHCPTTRAKLDALPTTPDYRERTALTHQTEAAEAKLVAQACASTEFSRYVGTQQTVYDMDFLRALFKAPKLNYIGYSYGTWLGTWYADTYPSRVGRFVLDSNMSWTSSFDANEAADAASFQRRRDQMLFPWIARHDATYHLGSTSAKVKLRYEQIRAGLVSAVKAGYDVPSGWQLDYAVVPLVYADADFPAAATTIRRYGSIVSGRSATAPALATAGRTEVPAVVIARAKASAGGARTAASAAATVDLGSLGVVVRCNDSRWSSNVTAYQNRTDAAAKRYPFIGYGNGVSTCAYWPKKQQPRTIDLAKVPRMLMVQSEGDPATGYEGALASHKKVSKQTRLVSVDNEGQHGLYIGGPSSCVNSIGDQFVFWGKLPTKDTVCGTSPLPGDTKVYRLSGPVGPKSGTAGLSGPATGSAAGRPNPLLDRVRRTSLG